MNNLAWAVKLDIRFSGDRYFFQSNLPSDVEQTLKILAQRAQYIAINHPLSIGLVVGEYNEQYLNVALSTPDMCYAQRIHYLPNNHSQKEKQEVSVMLILDMLSRWLNGR